MTITNEEILKELNEIALIYLREEDNLYEAICTLIYKLSPLNAEHKINEAVTMTNEEIIKELQVICGHIFPLCPGHSPVLHTVGKLIKELITKLSPPEPKFKIGDIVTMIGEALYHIEKVSANKGIFAYDLKPIRPEFFPNIYHIEERDLMLARDFINQMENNFK